MWRRGPNASCAQTVDKVTAGFTKKAFFFFLKLHILLLQTEQTICGVAAMQKDRLLEQIWEGAITVRSPDGMSPLARLLGALLTVPLVTLVGEDGGARPLALMETDELLPGASLGDVLAEELGLDVPRDAVVLIEPVAFADARSFSGRALGEELGRILADIAACADLPAAGPEPVRVAGADALRPMRRVLTRDFARILPEPERGGRQDGMRAQ